jgi:hypothetical protein
MQRHDVRCRECGVDGVLVTGKILRRGREVKCWDYIEHKETCSLFKRPQPKHLKKKAWRPQEKRAAALVGANLTPASGALGEDGDARSFHGWRIECKQTEKTVYHLKQSIWQKLVQGALQSGEEPLLHIELGEIVRPTTAPQPSALSDRKARRVIVRKDWYDGLLCPRCDQELERIAKRRSHVVGRGAVRLVELEPEGVEMDEIEFKKLKEKMDETAGNDQ